ncbi:MAG: rhomboid family intramembrane serine protease [Anaerolineales bacterium]|nr:rhomboid family intramembrane serine protease [Anaerolineales bacterium]
MKPFFDADEDPRSAPLEPDSAPQPVRLQTPYHAPKVTYFLIGLTALVYVAQLLTPAGNGIDLLELYGARINPYIRAGQLWRLITPVFLHASIPHIFFNMYALLVIGALLEKYYGPWRFTLLYFLGGFAGNVFSFLLGSENGFSVGASTAVFGLIAAEVIFFYQNRKILGEYAKQAMTNTLVVIVLNLLISLSPGIDGWGHVGGLLGGGIFAWFASPIWQVAGISPALRLEDRRGYRDWALGAIAVSLIFGLLMAWGFLKG